MSEKKDLLEKIASEFREFRQLNEDRLEAVKSNDEKRAEELEDYQQKANDRIDELEAKLKKVNTTTQTEGGPSEKMQAMNEFIQKAGLGKANEISDEHKSLLVKQGNLYGKSITTDTLEDGGVFSVDEFDSQIVQKLREISPMRQFASVKNVSTGDAWVGARRTGDSGANWTNERSSTGDTDTPTYKELRIQTHELEARPRVSRHSLEDSVINVASELQSDLADEFGQTEGTAFIVGDGIGKPEGALTNSNIGNVVNGSATDLDADKIIQLRYSIKEGYIPNGAFLLNRLSVAEVRKLKATDDNYLWQPGLANLQPPNILGAPYAMTPDLVAPDAAGDYSNGDKPILYGDFGRGYYIVDRIGMELLVDPYSAKPFVEYYTRKRVGGQVVQPEAIASLEMTT